MPSTPSPPAWFTSNNFRPPTCRAFAADAVPYTALFVSVGLPATFLTTLNADITAFEATITAKGAGTGTQAGATGGLEDAAHKAAVALHVLNTVVKNAYKTSLAEWATASHIQKHTPVTATTPAPPTPPVPPVPPVPPATPTNPAAPAAPEA